MHGSLAQEENMCRHFPLYYCSLKDSPFPKRRTSRNYPNHESGDVLITPNQVCMRSSAPDLHALPEEQHWSATLIATAAPNLKNGHELDLPLTRTQLRTASHDLGSLGRLAHLRVRHNESTVGRACPRAWPRLPCMMASWHTGSMVHGRWSR